MTTWSELVELGWEKLIDGTTGKISYRSPTNKKINQRRKLDKDDRARIGDILFPARVKVPRIDSHDSVRSSSNTPSSPSSTPSSSTTPAASSTPTEHSSPSSRPPSLTQSIWSPGTMTTFTDIPVHQEIEVSSEVNIPVKLTS